MKNTIFQLKSNPEIGFSIQEDYGNKYDPKTKQLKKTTNKVCQLWIDNYEGGEVFYPQKQVHIHLKKMMIQNCGMFV